jgi:hypothetical protein
MFENWMLRAGCVAECLRDSWDSRGGWTAASGAEWLQEFIEAGSSAKPLSYSGVSRSAKPVVPHIAELNESSSVVSHLDVLGIDLLGQIPAFFSPNITIADDGTGATVIPPTAHHLDHKQEYSPIASTLW